MQVPGIIQKDSWLSPYTRVIEARMQKAKSKHFELNSGKALSSFANGHLYFGLHKDPEGWIFREWAPFATAIYLMGTFNDWKESEQYRFTSVGKGNWELRLSRSHLNHKDL